MSRLTVGPCVKQGAVVSTRYSQVSVLRTIEDILGTEHINLNTAFQRPMAEVFDVKSSGRWTFAAEASTRVDGDRPAVDGSRETTQICRGRVVTRQHDGLLATQAEK